MKKNRLKKYLLIGVSVASLCEGSFAAVSEKTKTNMRKLGLDPSGTNESSREQIRLYTGGFHKEAEALARRGKLEEQVAVGVAASDVVGAMGSAHHPSAAETLESYKQDPEGTRKRLYQQQLGEASLGQFHATDSVKSLMGDDAETQEQEEIVLRRVLAKHIQQNGSNPQDVAALHRLKDLVSPRVQRTVFNDVASPLQPKNDDNHLRILHHMQEAAHPSSGFDKRQEIRDALLLKRGVELSRLVGRNSGGVNPVHRVIFVQNLLGITAPHTQVWEVFVQDLRNHRTYTKENYIFPASAVIHSGDFFAVGQIGRLQNIAVTKSRGSTMNMVSSVGEVEAVGHLTHHVTKVS